MAINFFAKDITSKKTVRTPRLSRAEGLPSSTNLTGVEIRLLPPYIIDNKTPRFAMFKGHAKLYCLTIVASDANNQLAGGIDLVGFPRIGDKEHLPINKSIFYWLQGETDKKAPSQIHIMITVMKSKKALREAGAILSKVKSDAEYKSILKQVTDLAKATTPVGVALSLVTDVASVVGKHLTEVEDKPLGTIINSYTALNGDFDKPGVHRVTYPTRNVKFEFDIIVRDAGKTTEAVTRTTRSPKKSAKPTRKAAAADGWDDAVEIDLIPLK